MSTISKWLLVGVCVAFVGCDLGLQAGEQPSSDAGVTGSSDGQNNNNDNKNPPENNPGGPPDGGPPVVSNPGGKRIFVTRATYDGNDFQSLPGADERCRVSALAAGYAGVWRAWLSDNNTDAAERLTDVGPWKLMGTERVAFKDLVQTRGYPSVNLDRDEYGEPFLTRTTIWTGTKIQGFRDPGSTCANWASESNSNSGRYGLTDATSQSWTDDGIDACYDSKHLLCFEQ